MVRAWIAGLSLGIAAAAAMAQESGILTFDAATVKARPEAELERGGLPPNISPAALTRMMMVQFRPQVEGGPGTGDPERVSYTNARLNLLLRDAYALRLNRITGPDWIEIDSFDVTAKIPPMTTQVEFREMLRNLLTERFALKVHRERRNGPIYTLVAAKGGMKVSAAGGSGPSAMKQFKVDLAPIRRKPEHPFLEYQLTCANMTIEELAGHLGIDLGADSIDRPVTNGTGLSGRYDFTLHWVGEADANTYRVPNIVKALERQLGLRLASGKGPVEVLVVDQASELPADN